jgi:hypothetical protein
MSELLKRYEESNKPRPAKAKEIPEVKTDFFDTNAQYTEGFTTFEKKGNPTRFNTTALDHYNTERKEVVIPSNFTPTEQGIDLGRWSPEKPYHQTGQGK